jgi:transcriptional regulator with XRE-family HTH domain
MKPVKPKTTPAPNGPKIKDLCWERRLSGPQLASKAGITRQHLLRICKGECGASLKVQQRIADVLNVSIKEIQQVAS